MKKLFTVLLAFGALMACQNKQQCPHAEMAQTKKVVKPWKSQIDSTMAAQETAWNQGDLEGFMAAYWKNDSMQFVGSRGLTYGWAPTLANYQKSYPTPEKMGQLLFKNDSYKNLNTNHALVIGRWHLFRQTDTLKGSYSLVWKFENNQWKIIADHSS